MKEDIELDAQLTLAARNGLLEAYCGAMGLPLAFPIHRARWYLSQPPAYRAKVLERVGVMEAMIERVMHDIAGGKLN